MKKRVATLNTAIISDIALWIVLALVLAGVIKFILVELPSHRGQQITLPFKNASAIIVGSPVRMMGTEVGYVSRIQVRSDHVDITIQSNPGALPIPPGTTFTILFTGLGGSESIEAVLPNHIPANGESLRGVPYVVQEPIRLNQMLHASTNMTLALQEGAENIADFFGKKKPVEVLQMNIRQAYEASQYVGKAFDSVESIMARAQRSIDRNMRKQLGTADRVNQQLLRVERATRPDSPGVIRFHEGLRRSERTLSSLSRQISRGQRSLDKQTVALGQSLQPLSSLTAAVLRQESAFHHWIIRPQPLKVIRQPGNPPQNAAEFIVAVDEWLTANPLEPILIRTQTQIQAFNRQVLLWDARLTARQNASSPGH